MNLPGRTISGLSDAFSTEKLGRIATFLGPELSQSLGLLDLEDWVERDLSVLAARFPRFVRLSRD